MEIRPAQKHELAEILALQKRAFIQEAELYNDYNISPLHQTLAETETEFATKKIYVAIIDEKIIGSIRIQIKKNTAYFGKLIVEPNYQNQGIGRKLLQFAEQEVNHIAHFELFTGQRSQKNLHLYQSMGYTITSIIAETSHVNLVVMNKENPNKPIKGKE